MHAIRPTFVLTAAAALLMPGPHGAAAADAEPQALRELKQHQPVPTSPADRPPLSPVREAALRDAAQALGVQTGLGEESRRIVELIALRSPALDARFRFNELVMGTGVLPPVISEIEDAVVLNGPVMRVAQRIYRIDEPARFVTIAPTWRSWLFVGLAPDLRPRMPQSQQLLPRDANEREFWSRVIDESYAAGVAQARSVFDANLARMERAYVGMRRFYELYARGMVTKPEIVAASSVIDREDPHTVVVGATIFKIARNTDFVEDDQRWRPLGR